MITSRKIAKTLKIFLHRTWRNLWRVGSDDPRRAVHALKVGFSLTVVSLLYLLEPSFKGIGSNAIWAVMTVVLVLEFTAGATLCKGLNRGLGTLLAGVLAYLIEYVAQESTRVFRAIFISTAVFAIGAVATYTRFIPYIKKYYEYGVVIFLLTFNLITVSSYRVQNVLEIARERFYMIAIGCGICLIMSLLVFPNWSGQDLHDSTVSKLEGLANSIEACVSQYFSNEEQDSAKDGRSAAAGDVIYKGYKAVLDLKATDETLALHASWEPCHSKYRLPWQHYVKLGDVLRLFGYTIVALHGCLQTEIQTPKSVRSVFKDPCLRLSKEVSKALRELADSIRNHRQCSPEILSDHLHQALHDLDAALKTQPKLFLGPTTVRESLTTAISRAKSSIGSSAADGDQRVTLRPTSSKVIVTSLEFSEALPFAAFASLLVEAVAKLDLVIADVEELGRVANFKEYAAGECGGCGDRTVEIVVDGDGRQRSDGRSGLENLPARGIDC